MDCATSILLAVIFLILTFFVYNWLFTSWDYWTSRGIPSVPGAIPIFGNTLSVYRLRENFGTLCTNVYDSNRGKSMVGLYNMKKPNLLIRDPELVKTVLQTSFNSFRHNDNLMDNDVDPLLGRDPFFERDQAWKDARALFTSASSSKRLKPTAHAAAKVCKKMEDYLKEQKGKNNYVDLEMKMLFSRYTAEVATNSVFSVEGNSFNEDYRGTFLESMKLSFDPTLLQAFKHNLIFFLPGLTKLLNTSFVPAKVDKFFRHVVKDVENARSQDRVPRNDVLQAMLDLENEKKIERIEVLGHVFSYFIESYETSSLTLSFMCYELAKHPEIQDEVRQEVETVLQRHDGQLTYESINELIYTHQVLNETMRLHAVLGVLTKVCAEKYRLEGSDGLSVDVEPDTTVLIPLNGLHMDPEIWDNPEEFNPERFRKGNDIGRHKFAFLPFGDGPRGCPGMRIAHTQMKAAIATLVKNYRIELSPKMKEPLRIDPRYFLTTALGGFWIRLHPLQDR